VVCPPTLILSRCAALRACGGWVLPASPACSFDDGCGVNDCVWRDAKAGRRCSGGGMPYAARGICAAPELRLVGSQQPQAVISGSVMTMTVRLLDGTRGVCVGYTALTEFTYEPHLKSRLHHRRIVVGVGSGSRHLRIVFRRLMPGSRMRPTWATRLPSQGLDEGGSVSRAAAQGRTDWQGRSIRYPPSWPAAIRQTLSAALRSDRPAS
jgi:hypothetical protein